MFRKPLVALLSFVALAQGCIIIDNDPDTNRASGDVTFKWTFGELSCAEMPEVANVRITVHGETLENGGLYPCSQQDFDGITLHDFAGGTYAYSIVAFNNQTEQLYSREGSFTIDGDITETVDLDPVGPFASITWSLPANSEHQNPTCEQAGVTHMDIWISDAAPVRVPCVAGTNGRAFRARVTPGGAYFVYLRATHVDETTGEDRGYYYASSSVVSQSGGALNHYDLDWYGGAKVTWEVYDSSNPAVKLTCAQAQIDKVYVNFKAEDGSWVYTDANGDPTSGDEQPCARNGNYALAFYDELIPGTYEVYVTSRASNNQVYDNSTQLKADLTITVAPAVFGDDWLNPLRLFMKPRAN